MPGSTKKLLTELPDMEAFQTRLNSLQQWKSVEPVLRKSVLDMSHMIRGLDDRLLYLESSLQSRISLEIGGRLKDKASQEDVLALFKDFSRLSQAVSEKASFQDVKDIVAASQSRMVEPVAKVDRKLLERIQAETRTLRFRVDELQSEGKKQQSQMVARVIQLSKRTEKKLQDCNSHWDAEHCKIMEELQNLREESRKKGRGKSNSSVLFKQSCSEINQNLTRISAKILQYNQKTDARIKQIESSLQTHQQRIAQAEGRSESVVRSEENPQTCSIVKLEAELEERIGPLRKQIQQIRERDNRQLSSGRDESVRRLQQRLQQFVQKFQENKVSLNNILKDQSLINNELCQECSFGRWIWHSSNSLGGKIGWEMQLRNLVPITFEWNKGGAGITIRQSGIYRVTTVFLTEKKFQVQTYVNNSLQERLERREGQSHVLESVISVQDFSLLEHCYKGQDTIGILFIQKI